MIEMETTMDASEASQALKKTDDNIVVTHSDADDKTVQSMEYGK